MGKTSLTRTGGFNFQPVFYSHAPLDRWKGGDIGRFRAWGHGCRVTVRSGTSQGLACNEAARAEGNHRVFCIRARAMRRAGELLKQIEPAHGANQNISAGSDTNVLTRTEAARDAGFSKRQQVTATRIASIPEHAFEDMVERGATVTELAAAGTQTREPNRDEARQLLAAVKGYADRLYQINLDEALDALPPLLRNRSGPPRLGQQAAKVPKPLWTQTRQR